MPKLSVEPPGGSAAAAVRQVAIIGNVCVGKTALFDELCADRPHSVNIPGSTLAVTRGALALGSAAAAPHFRRHCGSCSAPPSGATSCPDTVTASRCPALSASRSPWWSPRRRLPIIPAAPPVIQLYDTPGSATLAPGSEDEMVARSLLLSGQLDGVLLVADAKNLRRSLALALEVATFGLPMVLALNMADEAESMGLAVDEAALARALSVPVASSVAVERRGVHRLAELVLEAAVSDHEVPFPEAIAAGLAELEPLLESPLVAPRGLANLLLRSDGGAEAWVAEHLGAGTLARARAIRDRVQATFATPLGVLVTDAFYAEAERIVDRVVTSHARSPDLLVAFGRLAQRPLVGSLIAAAALLLAYCWVGLFGATFVVDRLDRYLFDGLLLPACQRLVATIPSAFVRDAIMDPDFGLLPTGLFLAVGLVLPVLLCFYLLQAVAEDSGYLPRLAVLFDRALRPLGLNGKGLIALVLGFSCITMAVITTRMLPTRRERVILTLLLILGVPCAPLLAVMLVVLGKLPLAASVVLFGIIASQILLAGVLASKIVPGKVSDLILEVPRMRVPRPWIVLQKTWRRSGEFLREAVPVFLGASFAVFLFDRSGGLSALERTAAPIVSGVLGLPDKAVPVFIKTIIRRENGAAELRSVQACFTNLQLVVTMLVMTFLMPCINTLIVIVKERGLKTATAMLLLVSIWAIVTGAVLNLVCHALGVTFT